MSNPFELLGYLEEKDPFNKYAPKTEIDPATGGRYEPKDPLESIGSVEVVPPEDDPFMGIHPFYTRPKDEPAKSYTFINDVNDLVKMSSDITVKALNFPVFPIQVAAAASARAGKQLSDTLGKVTDAALKPLEWLNEYDKQVGHGLRLIPDLFGIHDSYLSKLPQYPATYEVFATAPIFQDIPKENPEAEGTLEMAKPMLRFLAGGVGGAAFDPTNVLVGGTFKGTGLLLKTTGGKKAIEVFTNSAYSAIKKFGGEKLLRGLQLGEYELPFEFKEYVRKMWSERIYNAEIGKKILDSAMEITPDELKKLESIYQGSISGDMLNIYKKKKAYVASQIAAGIAGQDSPMVLRYKDALVSENPSTKKYAFALRNFIESLQLSLLRADETQRQIDKTGLMSNETAAYIKNTLGIYLPRIIRAYEAPLKEGKIPGSVLADMWALPERELAAIEGLSPLAANDIIETYNRAATQFLPNTGGYRKVRVAQSNFKPRFETKRSLEIWDKFNNEQIALKKAEGSYNLDVLGFSKDSDVALLNEASFKLEDFATATPESLKALQEKASKTIGRTITDSRMKDIVSKAKQAITERNKGWARIAELEGKKKMVRFYADAKFSLEDMAGTNLSNKELADQMSRLAGRPFTEEEVVMASDMARGYLKGYLKASDMILAARGELKAVDIRDLTFDFEKYRIALGDNRDPRLRVIKAMHDLNYSYTAADLFNSTALNKKWVLPKGSGPMAGFKLMPNDRKLGALAGKYVKTSIADEITEIQRFKSEFDQFGVKAMATWKLFKVSSPGTVLNNIYGNIQMADWAGVSWSKQLKHLETTIPDTLSRKGWYLHGLKEGKMALTNFSDSELGLLKNELLDNYYGTAQETSLPMRALNMLTNNILARKFGEGWATAEVAWKLAVYKDFVEKGIAPAKAGLLAENALINYADVPPWIRELRKSPIGAPFITFPYKLIPMVTGTLLEHPFRILKYNMMLDVIEKGAASAMGIVPEDLDYIKSTVSKGAPLFSKMVMLPFQDKDGSYNFWDATTMLPYGNLSDINGIFGSFLPGGLGKPVLEVLGNFSIYSGEKIYGRDINTSNMADYLYKLHKDNLAEGEGEKIGQEILSYLIKAYAPSWFPSVSDVAKGVASATGNKNVIPSNVEVEGGFAYERARRAFVRERNIANMKSSGESGDFEGQLMDLAKENPDLIETLMKRRMRRQSSMASTVDSLFGIRTFQTSLKEAKQKLQVEGLSKVRRYKSMIKRTNLRFLSGEINKDQHELELQTIQNGIEKTVEDVMKVTEGPYFIDLDE